MYEPAGEVNEVGGDFYEVFPVEGGWAVVLGDVSGKGAAAAAVTAEARHTIRTAGAARGRPGRGARRTRPNLRGRDDVSLCSVAMLSCPTPSRRAPRSSSTSPATRTRCWSATARATPVGKPGPLLGVVDEPNWPPVAVAIEPGDQLVLYTDGVIEARGEGGERFGSERLRLGLEGCDGARARGRAGARGALGVRRSGPRRRRGAGRDSPQRRRQRRRRALRVGRATADLARRVSLRRRGSPAGGARLPGPRTQAGTVGRVDRGGRDLEHELVAVELLERDVGRIARRHRDRLGEPVLDVSGETAASKRARISTRSGSRSGTTARLRMTLLGTMIRSAPATRVV